MEVSYTTFNDDMTEYKPQQHHFQPSFYHLNKVSDCTPICDVWKKKKERKTDKDPTISLCLMAETCVFYVFEKRKLLSLCDK